MTTLTQRGNALMRSEEQIKAYNNKLNQQTLAGAKREQQLETLISLRNPKYKQFNFDKLVYVHSNTKIGVNYLQNLCKYKEGYVDYIVINDQMDYHQVRNKDDSYTIEPFMTMSGFDSIAYALSTDYGSISTLAMRNPPSNDGIDLVHDIIEVKDCPTSYPFDLRKAEHDYYRVWYLEQQPAIKIRVPINLGTTSTIIFHYRVLDLMIFYGHYDFSREKENIGFFDKIKDKYKTVFTELQNARIIVKRPRQPSAELDPLDSPDEGSDCESENDFSPNHEDDYISMMNFEKYFLRFIPSKFAKRLFGALYPKETHGVAYHPVAKRNVEVKLPSREKSAAKTDKTHGKSAKRAVPSKETVQQTQPTQIAPESTKFDPTRSCDYVYRAKWILSKQPRMTEIDGNPMVSVVDMMYMHGDYEDFESASSQWRKYKGKEELKDLKVHEVAPASGGKPVAFISFLGFELHVLPQIKKGLGRLIASKVYHTGVGVHLGSQKVMDLILDARENFEALAVSDPKTAAILWELKERYEKIDILYLDDIYEAQLKVRGAQGYVYLVTSAHLNAVKIGHWGGTVEDLRKRYATYFGSSLSLEVLHVADRKAVEKHLHTTFAEFRLENELFKKYKYDEYYRCLTCMKVQISNATTLEPAADEPTELQVDVPMQNAVESTDFDPTRSCDYVYRAKWILSKEPRMTDIDGNPMVSVVDMMYIHGGYDNYKSALNGWAYLGGKEELKELVVHEVEPANGGNLVAFISFWDFDRLVLPLIKKGLAADLRNAWKMIGPAAMLGSSRLIEIIKDNRASMLEFVKEDPRAAAILWGQLMEVEKLQEPYVTPTQAMIQSNPFGDGLQVNQAQELTKQIQAQELTKQIVVQEESKRHLQAEETARLAKEKDEESKRHLQSEETTRFAKERDEESKRHLQAEETARLAKQKEEETKRHLQKEETSRFVAQEITKRKDLELKIVRARNAAAKAKEAKVSAPTASLKRKEVAPKKTVRGAPKTKVVR